MRLCILVSLVLLLSLSPVNAGVPVEVFELAPIGFTSADQSGKKLVVGISLKYERNPDLKRELQERQEQIRHLLGIILSGKKERDLRTRSGRAELDLEIPAHLNVILVNGKITGIIIRDVKGG